MNMKRLTICLRNEILSKLDSIISERKFPNRSQAISEFIKRASINKNFRENKKSIAIISYIAENENYDTSKKIDLILNKINRNFQLYTSNLNNRKISVIILEDLPLNLQKIADEIRAQKGIISSSFSILEATK